MSQSSKNTSENNGRVDNPKFNVVILADHTIGYRLTEFLLQRRQEVDVVSIYTNKNSNSWWKPLDSLSGKYDCTIHYYENEAFLYHDLHKKKSIDFIFCFSWKHLLSERIIKIPKKGAINLHYSLLPKYRGVYPVNWSIIKGEQMTGITFHFINNRVDRGDIIAQKKVRIKPSFTSVDLLRVLDEAAYSTFIKIWAVRSRWHLISKAQEGKSSYFSYKDFALSNEIDLDKYYKASDFINFLRGKTFYPYKNNAYFIDKRNKKKIFLNLLLSEESEKSD